MITEKQYRKALSIVAEYQEQMSRRKAVQMKLAASDLIEMSGTIQIPKLTDQVVGEDYTALLEEELDKMGHSVLWVSLDDLGYISITFNDRSVNAERIESVLEIINRRQTQ